MTLIELLVVIIILTTIVAAAIPIMAPSNDDRRLREATRGLNTYITGAQARAISLGRPYGVALKRLSADTGRAEDNGVCLEVFYVEQQPPFAGFDRNSKACVANLQQFGLAAVRFVTNGSPTGFSLPVGLVPDLFPPGTFRPGDIVEVNGTQFEMLDPEPFNINFPVNVMDVDDQTDAFRPPQQRSTPTVLVRPLNDTGQQIKPKHNSRGQELGAADPRALAPYWTAPAPYRILRQATYASDEPYQLPEGTAIDLRASGLGADDYFYVPGMHDNADRVMIMFAPEGRVSRLWYNQKPTNSAPDAIFDEPVADNVYLLVGKRENVPAPPVASDPTLDPTRLSAASTDELRAELREPINWLSGNSRWLVVGSQSGRIVTIENAFVDLPSIAILSTPTLEHKRNQQISDAREFTREMTQLGGR